jgi:hypothetical protein
VPLTTSERVKLMKSIGEVLSEPSWDEINLTLEQFGMTPPGGYEGSAVGYILKAIKDASDEKLIELAAHLEIEVPSNAVAHAAQAGPQSNAAALPPVDEATFRIFLSHLSSQQAFAGQVQSALSTCGLSSFVAHVDVQPTTEWRDVIESELRRCDALIALMHSGFHQSDWTDQEIGYAMGRNKPAFAVNFGQVPYGFIGKFQAFFGGTKTATDIATELLTSLTEHPDTRIAVSRAMVRKFGQSGSFASSVRLLAWLEALNYWDDDMAAHLQWALKNNGQVYNETIHRVPRRTATLATKWASTKPA